MTAQHHRRRRLLARAGAAAAGALAAALLAGCSSNSNAADCLPSTGTIADSLTAIHEAGLDAANDPARTAEAIAIIDANLVRIGDLADQGKVGKAVHDLDTAVADYNKAILSGNTHPDASSIDAPAAELYNVCRR